MTPRKPGFYLFVERRTRAQYVARVWSDLNRGLYVKMYTLKGNPLLHGNAGLRRFRLYNVPPGDWFPLVAVFQTF